MKGILPEAVRLRSDYCFLDGDDDLRTHERERCSILVDRAAQTLGCYLETQKLREAWNSFQQGYISATWTLCEPLLLEAWLRPLPSSLGAVPVRLEN
jgi:hypothetical protein